jgi:dCTP deaminase
MVVSDKDLKELLSSKRLAISPLSAEVTESAIDLHLDSIFLEYPPDVVIDSREKSNITLIEQTFPESGRIINPGDFILVQTLELVELPNDVMGWVENSGSLAKTGIQIHLCDAHIDAGFKGQVSLQITNQGKNPVKIYPHQYIGKMYFFYMSTSVDRPYRGSAYNQSKPV